jgi:hypothetical protein
MDKKMKLVYLMLLNGKKPYWHTVKNLKSSDVNKAFRFISDMDIGTVIPWFAEKAK